MSDDEKRHGMAEEGRQADATQDAGATFRRALLIISSSGQDTPPIPWGRGPFRAPPARRHAPGPGVAPPWPHAAMPPGPG